MPDRPILRRVVPALAPPPEAERAAAVAERGDRPAHDGFAVAWSCLNEMEQVDPPAPPPPASELVVAAWNLERCKHVEASAEQVRLAGVDVLLATELDAGMARSGQRHATRDLGAHLGFGHVFAVEFVELGLGDEQETLDHAGQRNVGGLHGNAILSRWPLEAPAVIPLDVGGEWFVTAPKGDDQLRVGGRMAVAARIAAAGGPLTLAAVHYESESDAEGRARQTARLLHGLDALYGDGPAIVGGDLNTKGFRDAGLEARATLADPASVEPAFALFAERGFDWRACNAGEPTTRRPRGAPAGAPLQTLDWLFVRGVEAADPFVRPALSIAGDDLSDHELIGVRIRP